MQDEPVIAGLPRRRIKVPALAELLGVTKLTIYRWIKEGKLTPCRVSTSVSFIDLDEVERMIAANNPQSGGA
jgi:excisionase family DNA binding protein